MTKRNTGIVVVTVLLAAVVVAWMAVGRAQGQRGGAQGGAAQQAPPVRIRIQVTQVKADMSRTYQDLIKSTVVPGLKKAGQPWQWVFTTGAVGQANTFVTVRPIANYAEFDQPGALQRAIGADGVASFQAKITPTIVSQQSWVQTLNQNMSIVSNASAPPALVLVQDFQVLPGKNQDFASLMTSEYLPAYKKAGVKDFWVYATNIGGPGGRITTVRPIAKYAELDQPGLLNRAGLAQEAIQQLNARRAALTAGNETNVSRFVPELSYGIPTPLPASTGN
jgi:hypothetical protein